MKPLPVVKGKRAFHVIVNRKSSAYSILEMVTAVGALSIASLMVHVVVGLNFTLIGPSLKANVGGESVSQAPAMDTHIDAVLLHNAFAKLYHEAEFVYVFGGKAGNPNSTTIDDYIRCLSKEEISSMGLALNQLADEVASSERLRSSFVARQILFDQNSDWFEDSSTGHEEDCVIVLLNSLLKFTGAVSIDSEKIDGFRVYEVILYEPGVTHLEESDYQYRFAIEENIVAAFEARGDTPDFLYHAEHYWLHVDDVNYDPEDDDTDRNFYNRHGEGFCLVQFPDPRIKLREDTSAEDARSGYTYCLRVVR